MRSNLSIETDGYKELSNGKLKEEISAKILRSGLEEGTYGKYSSGERGRIDISSTCAIQTLLNLSCESGGLNFLGVDEALDSIDSKGIESIINALQDIGKTIMIISQNTSVNIDSRYLVKIQKHLGIGKIVI
jgi:exonuclease SbcC